MNYTVTYHKLARAAHFIGPGLLFLATLLYVFDVGRNSDGFSSQWEGVLGVWAIIFYYPTFLLAARTIGANMPRFGIVTAIVGLGGATGGVVAMAYRVVWGSFEQSGWTEEQAAMYIAERTEHFGMLFMAPLTLGFPLAHILVGIGFLRAKPAGLPASAGTSLIVAGIVFAIAQITEAQWALLTLYPASALLAMVGFGLHAKAHTKAA